MNTARRALGTALLATLPAVSAGDLRTDLDVRYGHGLDANDTVQASIDIEPVLDVEAGSRWEAVLSVRLRLDTENRLEPGEAVTDSYASPSKPATLGDHGSLELRDAYVERAIGNGLLRLGKQQIVWGRLDGIKVLDVLNPQDFREFILDDFDRSRIGLWSAYLDLPAGAWRTELALIADNTGHAVPRPGAWFELRAPRFRFGADPGLPSPPTRTRRRDVAADTSAIAARVSRRFGAVDVAAVAYSGMDHEPLGRLDVRGSAPVLEQFYERRELYGLSAESAAGRFAFRAELALQPNRAFNTRGPAALDTVTLDQSTAGLGIDVDAPFGVFMNAQYIVDRVSQAPDMLVRPSRDRIVTAFLKRDFRYDTLSVSLRGYYSRDLGDRMLSLGIDMRPSDSVTLRFSADGFSGDRRGLFGQFRDRDRVTLRLAYTF